MGCFETGIPVVGLYVFFGRNALEIRYQYRKLLSNYVRKHIHIAYFLGVVGVFWVLLNFWRSGQKVSGDEMCPVRVHTNPQNPIANNLPVVNIFGGERGFLVSHVCFSPS